MHVRPIHLVCLLCVFVAFIPGCATAPRSPAGTPSLWRGDGTPATSEQARALVAHADFILLGENHGHALNLTQNAERWAWIVESRPKAALALEFFERDQQVYLDDYLAGLIDEPTFRQLARKTTESGYPAGHRAMVEAAKASGRPVIAANAPRVYVRRARTNGLESLRSLTPEQQRLLRLPDVVPTGRYRDDFGAFMGQTPATAARVDAMFLSQSVWDWTMADSLVRASAASTPVVLVVGRFHIDHHGGLVQALERLAPGKTIVTITSIDAWAQSELAPDDKGRADLVSYVGPSNTREP